MTKYSTKEKLEAVLVYLEGKESYKTIAEKRKMSMAPLKRWVLRYREHGVEGLVSSYTNYDIEFKSKRQMAPYLEFGIKGYLTLTYH
jgi:transposase